MSTMAESMKESIAPNAPVCRRAGFLRRYGDLAHKKIFPSLQALAKRGNLDVPVIGVAKAGWTLDQLKSRARDSVERYGGLDPDAFSSLSRRMDYVDGDYADPATFQELRRKLGNAKQPLHYLAIPPSLFETVIRRLGESGCAEGARMVIEKPFGHDLATAKSLNGVVYKLLWIVRAGEDAPIFAHRLSICHSYLAYPTGPRRSTAPLCV